VKGTYSAHRVNYKAGFEFDVAPQSMIYGSVVTGFKSGGQSNADIDPYKPEDVTAYTIGAKNRFFGRLLQLNLELFWMDYKNRQENFSQLDRGGAQVSSLFNAGKAVAKGVSARDAASDRQRQPAGGHRVHREQVQGIQLPELQGGQSVGLDSVRCHGDHRRQRPDRLLEHQLQRLPVAAHAEVVGHGGLYPHLRSRQRREDRVRA
jgi:hypothetical protein